ncbi:5-oxoprolinase subunit PxpB [Postechiella marina]|uniref:5-oxoprolinase subunit PxpB n=1 Tax=Postechiella marina TaxID=943941 RepID=A0ABP8CFY6_9FLAO
MSFNITYKRFGKTSILIEWPTVINDEVLQDVLNFKFKIENKAIKGLIQITNAYNSLLVIYNEALFAFEEQLAVLKGVYLSQDIGLKNTSRLWRIPVCYDAHFGIDLNAIALDKNISIDQVIKIHSQTIYTVYFIGFLPGFLYLGGLDASIFMPRKATPRLKINKGSVAIGGEQTGVYPSESPGGWNIIGNSPINFFDVTKQQPCFAKAGDKIKFYPISLKVYKDIKTLVDAHVYVIENNRV